MRLSDAGLRFIADFEGYHKALPDGRCQAYRCQIGNGMDDGKWTIGFGCTEGVYGGLVWTRQQAEAAFRQELSRFEAAVTRLVTVPISQNQYDALVSFAYNCGEGALAKSSILARLNAGDPAGAARSFAPWNKSRGIVVAGLVRRRASEAAVFMQPDALPAEPVMPQHVDEPAATEQHFEWHDELSATSLWYQWKGRIIAWVGGSSILGAGSAPHWLSNPVDVALVILGVGLLAVIGIEIMRLRQRKAMGA